MVVLRVAARSVAVALLLALASPLVWKLVTGDFYMTVEGRSMLPTYQVGDVLVVQGPTGRELGETGTAVIVSFGTTRGQDAPMYVHRVVEPLEDGSAWLQGDNNPGRDPRPVTPDAVLGTPRAALTGPVGTVFTFTQSLLGRILLGGAALVLLLAPIRRADRRPSDRQPPDGRPSDGRPGAGSDRADAARPRSPAARVGGSVVASAAAMLLVGPMTPPASAEPGAVRDLVSVSGAPLVHTFDLDVPGDSVTGRWEVNGTSPTPVPYDGLLVTEAAVPDSLAHALVVHYGELGPDGQVAAWHDGGTLVDPVAYADALARIPAVSAGHPTVIPVRVSLPDPSAVTGQAGAPAAVQASFTVSYLAGAAVGAGSTAHAGAALAVTGPGPWLGLLAAALVAAGAALLTARRSRPRAAEHTTVRRHPIDHDAPRPEMT